jgi:hypothetical protein
LCGESHFSNLYRLLYINLPRIDEEIFNLCAQFHKCTPIRRTKKQHRPDRRGSAVGKMALPVYFADAAP